VELAGLMAPVVTSDEVRAITAADRTAISACEDANALLALSLAVMSLDFARGRRAVSYTIGAVGILGGVLIISQASALLTATVLVALVVLFVLGYGMQKRARAKAIRAAEWVGPINFRLAQLAAKPN